MYIYNIRGMWEVSSVRQKMVQKKKKFIFGLVLIVVILLLLTHTPIISAEGEGVIPVTNNLNHQVEPVIYGDYIVWTDYRNDNGSGLNSDIYLYDLSTHQERAICTGVYN